MDGEAAVIAAAELHGGLVDGRLAPEGDGDEREGQLMHLVGTAVALPLAGVRLVAGLLTAGGGYDLLAERDGLSGLRRPTST